MSLHNIRQQSLVLGIRQINVQVVPLLLASMVLLLKYGRFLLLLRHIRDLPGHLFPLHLGQNQDRILNQVLFT